MFTIPISTPLLSQLYAICSWFGPVQVLSRDHSIAICVKPWQVFQGIGQLGAVMSPAKVKKNISTKKRCTCTPLTFSCSFPFLYIYIYVCVLFFSFLLLYQYLLVFNACPSICRSVYLYLSTHLALQYVCTCILICLMFCVREQMGRHEDRIG